MPRIVRADGVRQARARTIAAKLCRNATSKRMLAMQRTVVGLSAAILTATAFAVTAHSVQPAAAGAEVSGARNWTSA